MAATRDELRDHLLAVLEAAPELPKDDRTHLADVFLKDLDAHFRLVPRPQHGGWSDDLFAALTAFFQSGRRLWPVLAVVIGLVFLLPLLLFPVFVLLHPPILLLVLVIILVARSRGPGMRRRRMMMH